MDHDTVIKIDGLYKKFSTSLKRSMAYGTADIARAMLGIKYDTGKLRKGEFWSLQDINLEIKRGETFGLVGANGSGKTTLLRLINGIFPPDKGTISIRGRIGALIAVGAGFHPHMTGRENIHLNATILGMTEAEIAKNMDSIIDFAGIGEFLDAPVSTYSSGMYVRLGFAIAIHSTPDIVLVDEILAVGDSKFQRKCLDKIRDMRKQGTTFLLVSHNMQNIEAMCNRAVLLNKGAQVMVGSPQEIIPVYELLLQTSNVNLLEKAASRGLSTRGDLELVHKYSDFGTDEIKVTGVRCLNEGGEKNLEFQSGDGLLVEIDVDSSLDVRDGIMYMTIDFVNARQSIEENITCIGVQKRYSLEKGRSTLRFGFGSLGLTTGEYDISFNLFDDTYTNPYTQGYYGYFRVYKEIPTMLRVSKGTPMIWADPEINISNTK